MSVQKFRKVLVTGGAGYVGCVLIPKLLDGGYRVVVYDCMYFGSGGLRSHPDLEVVHADIRDTARFLKAAEGVDAVIHLACVSNDPSFELDPTLGKSINYDCFEPLVKASREAGAKRFIYASSSSVYGVSDADQVTEEHPLQPLTDYSRFKGLCESILASYRSDDFVPVTLRPATVCGYSPRMRLDLTVNILTNFAVNRGKIKVFGGSQKRPNIHIDDITDLYVRLLEFSDETVSGKIYNAGYENRTVADLALMVKEVVTREFPDRAPIEIETVPTDDLRSYHVSSGKIEKELGFKPTRTIEDSITDLCHAFKRSDLPNSFEDERYFNVQVMKAASSAVPTR